MKFSLVHPTARVKPMGSFRTGWFGALWEFHRYSVTPWDVQYIVVVHESRLKQFWLTAQQMQDRDSQPFQFWGQFEVVVNHGRDCLVDQWNTGCAAARGEIILAVQDDLYPQQDWDRLVAQAIGDTSQPVALHCSSGSKRDANLFLPAIQTRVLSDLIGPSSPDYESMFADDEWTAQVRKLGKVIERPDIRFEHRHPVFGTAEMDEVYAQENRDEAYRKGREVFERRKAQGFPRVELSGSRTTPVSPKPEPKLIAFCTPGESFSWEWVARTRELDTFFADAGYCSRPYMGCVTNVYSARIDMMARVIEEAKQLRPDYVLMLDDDNLLLPEQARALLNYLELHPDVDGISGWCWIRKKDRWLLSCGMFADDGRHMEPLALDKLFEGGVEPKRFEVGGFPCFLMRYSVLEALGANAFMPMLSADQPEWFGGEDISFFNRAHQAGFKFVVDPLVKVAHLKLQSQEPDVVMMNKETPETLKQWREQINGKAVVAPKEYQAV